MRDLQINVLIKVDEFVLGAGDGRVLGGAHVVAIRVCIIRSTWKNGKPKPFTDTEMKGSRYWAGSLSFIRSTRRQTDVPPFENSFRGSNEPVPSVNQENMWMKPELFIAPLSAASPSSSSLPLSGTIGALGLLTVGLRTVRT